MILCQIYYIANWGKILKKQRIFNSTDAWQSQIINPVNPLLYKSPSPIRSKNSFGQDSNTSCSVLLHEV